MKLSVTQLVEFSCRGGDLAYGGVHGPSAKEGMQAHQKLQKELADSFESEVSFKTTLIVDEMEVVLGGRIDLIKPALEHSPAIIREIKSTLVPPARIPAAMQLQHWAQLKVYAYCYLCRQRDEKSSDNHDLVLGELLWMNLLDQQQTIESGTFNFSELEQFVVTAIQRYLVWWRQVDEWRIRTRATATNLAFPFGEFRTGQRDMAAATFRALRDSTYLMCEAPTGIGKTLSALFPALKAIGEEHVSQLVYLTAKTSGRAIALDAVNQMRNSGLETTVLVLQSKVRICHCANGTCSRDDDGRCPLTIGFFDRLPEAMEHVLQQGVIDGSALDAAAAQFQVCPFELSLQMLPWVSVVICDYNYVFDPLVRLTRFSEPNKNIALLMDEVHNLVDRSRGMYSAQLTRSQNRQVARDCQVAHPELARALAGLTRALDRWSADQQDSETATTETPDTVTRAVGKCVESMSRHFEQSPPLPESALDWFKELFRYRVIEELYADQHRTVTRIQKRNGYKDIELRLMCINAADWLRKSYKLFRGAVAFSATLRPQAYFHSALGLPESTSAMVLASPFSGEHLGVFVCPFVDTRYKARDDSMTALVELIADVVSQKKGNYLIFFPSYAYLDQVHQVYTQSYPLHETIVQERDFSLSDRDVFLERFADGAAVVGFAIMGGVFGEGIDYLGDQLIGCVVVGTGLPGLGIEQKLIAEGYALEGLDGFDYAYRYPGFTRVLQTAGRVIRTESDRGVVVLVDQRFQAPFYTALYPEHWKIRWCNSNQVLAQGVAAFWTTALD